MPVALTVFGFTRIYLDSSHLGAIESKVFYGLYWTQRTIIILDPLRPRLVDVNCSVKLIA